jgi:hypothetical protein
VTTEHESPVNDAAQLTIVKLTINENQQALDVSLKKELIVNF